MDTKEECEALARQFGFADTKASISNNTKMPPKCYYKTSSSGPGYLWLNTAVVGNRSPCTENRICLCKNGLQPDTYSNENSNNMNATITNITATTTTITTTTTATNTTTTTTIVSS